ncbi:bifunctional biotin--[acetyl-CoA-carboxylase] ligase/biotin operon repressor BirA [Pseudomonas flexibilis]|uniref:Bifunctional ligase/repressor BirA n=1 Tax=Pseudomonas flexibilis TaxID=706570 RepID=A0A1N7BQW0_9PSED|nr:bifunctional biotin--[acetyl-CoA-carboxylase] ligase/biotin operon repressor BirA [Pseudomonas flexibilis]SIR53705.1 BirA family transcriptional regulator, biotin operon repressor / biotin-[acetyl-CoA-carboxylase] ligase [Pseudomonas flexibilis]
MPALLELLKDGAFHSGEKLGEALGISRAAVWKQLQQLESQLGLTIHKVPGKGYCLSQRISLLDPSAIDERFLGLQHIYLSETLDSTNAEALRLISQRKPLPFLVLSEQQTSGRGRRGRTWVSPFGANLYYSLAIQLVQGAQQLEGLSLVIGLAVLRTIEEAGVTNAGLKWPNDILVGHKKMAGILLELVGDPADICHVVIGVGINVNMLSSKDEIDRPWTSLLCETGILQDRGQLASRLNYHISHYLGRHRSNGFTTLMDEWRAADLWMGREVRLSSGMGEVAGTSLGIDERGGLRLLVGGAEQVFCGGELSLRLRDDS